MQIIHMIQLLYDAAFAVKTFSTANTWKLKKDYMFNGYRYNNYVIIPTYSMTESSLQ